MSEGRCISVGGLQVRLHEREVMVRGNAVPLSSREFDILSLLAEHPGWVFSADQLCGEADHPGYSPDSVGVLMSRLRRKLATAGEYALIETVRGFGYRLRRPDAMEELKSEASEVSSALVEASWRLQAAAIEVEHLGTVEQQRSAIDVLERARRTLYASLAD